MCHKIVLVDEFDEHVTLNRPVTGENILGVCMIWVKRLAVDKKEEYIIKNDDIREENDRLLLLLACQKNRNGVIKQNRTFQKIKNQSIVESR